MTCSEDRRNVRKFLEDLLEEGEYQRVRSHVEGCASCTQFVRTAGSVSSMLMDMARAGGTDDLVDTILFQIEKKRRAAPAPPAAAPAPVPAPETTARAAAPAGLSPAFKAFLALCVLAVAGLMWRDWVQTRLLEELLRKAPAAAVSAPAATPLPSVRGDFEWGNVVVHWPSGVRPSLPELIGRFSPNIRYEAPGLMVVRVPAARDAEWRAALAELPGLSLEETSASAAGGDRLYTIDYREE